MCAFLLRDVQRAKLQKYNHGEKRQGEQRSCQEVVDVKNGLIFNLSWSY